jgi:hypothetical protein
LEPVFHVKPAGRSLEAEGESIKECIWNEALFVQTRGWATKAKAIYDAGADGGDDGRAWNALGCS